MNNIREKRKNEILLSAMEVFSKKGYDNTKMEDIAINANIGKGTIYEYFSSKVELFSSCISMMIIEYGNELERLMSGNGTFREKLTIYFDFSTKCYEHGKFVFEIFQSDFETHAQIENVYALKQRKETEVVMYMIEEAILKNEITGDIEKNALCLFLRTLAAHSLMCHDAKNKTQDLIEILFNGIAIV